MSEPLLIVVGLVAGIFAGTVGVGGGVIFVPALIAGGLALAEAQATSLFAILPVAIVGAWRQSNYGNLRLKEGLTIGALGSLGALVGVGIVHHSPERLLRIAFAGFLLFIALQLIRREVLGGADRSGGDPEGG